MKEVQDINPEGLNQPFSKKRIDQKSPREKIKNFSAVVEGITNLKTQLQTFKR